MSKARENIALTTVEDSTFKRGFYKNELSGLKENRFWKAIKDDPELKPYLREDEIHVYYRGCKICGVIWRNGKILFETHHKYLKRKKNGSDYVLYDAELNSIKDDQRLGTSNDYPKFIKKIKDVAEKYANGEKIDIHKIIIKNKNILDLEVSFGGIDAILSEGKKIKLHKRIDFAIVKKISNDEIQLQFFEAKLHSNSELRCKEEDKNAPIINQLNLYDELIKKHKDNLINSYNKIIENFCELGFDNFKEFQGMKVSIDTKTKLIITSIPKNSTEKSKVAWEGHLKKIEVNRGIENIKLLVKGNFKIELE